MWISVKDRLPENDNAVFCFTCDAVMAYQVLRYKLYDGSPHRFWSNEINIVHKSVGSYVTHWMPLPEPPEVKS